MRAIVQSGYGEPRNVLTIKDVERPVPGDHEVLVRVVGSSVNPGDWMSLVGRPYVLRIQFGLTGPRRAIGGRDVAGVVEAVGSKVTLWQPGDEVYGELTAGAYADYAVAAEDVLAAKPTSLDFSAAAAVPLAGATALQGIRDAGAVRAGQRVLVNGASGGVGSFAVQVARSLGAHVIGVCSTDALELVRSIGADEAIDYTRQDFTESGKGYDLIFDLVGNQPLSACRRALRPGGVYVGASGMPGGGVLGPLPYLLRVMLARTRDGRSLKPFAAKPNADDLTTLAELIDAGDVRPVIEHTYGFAQVADALARQGEGHARGKSVINVAADGGAA